MTNRVQHEFTLVRNYHTCLIADVVTETLDVREEAVQLPDTVAEPESTADPDAAGVLGDEVAGDLDAVAQQAGK